MSHRLAKTFLMSLIAMALAFGTIGCSGEPSGRSNTADAGKEAGKGQAETPAFDPNK